MVNKGKVGVLVEEHFDPTEYRRFNEFFPENGYEVEYISHLWGNPSLRFGSNPENDRVEYHVTVTTEVQNVQPSDYRALILIGAYAMDRLRYQASVRAGQPNSAPAVVFLRRVMQTPGIKVGTICHSLWLLCADRKLLEGRQVTCAHNIICDVENAGGRVVYDGDQTVDLVRDKDLITGKHPGVIERFLKVMLQELES
jgi:protease I